MRNMNLTCVLYQFEAQTSQEAWTVIIFDHQSACYGKYHQRLPCPSRRRDPKGPDFFKVWLPWPQEPNLKHIDCFQYEITRCMTTASLQIEAVTPFRGCTSVQYGARCKQKRWNKNSISTFSIRLSVWLSVCWQTQLLFALLSLKVRQVMSRSFLQKKPWSILSITRHQGIMIKNCLIGSHSLKLIASLFQHAILAQPKSFWSEAAINYQ